MKSEVLWFAETIPEDILPCVAWDMTRSISKAGPISFVVEVAAALVLFDLRWEEQGLSGAAPCSMQGVVVGQGTDSQSAKYAVSKLYTSKDPGAAFIRALAARCNERNCLLELAWQVRAENTWADLLSKGLTAGSDPARRRRVNWQLYRAIQEDLGRNSWSWDEL